MWFANVSIDRRAGKVFAGALNAAPPRSIWVLEQALASALPRDA